MQKRTTSLPDRAKPEYLVRFIEPGRNRGNAARNGSLRPSGPSPLLSCFLPRWAPSLALRTHLHARSPLSFCLIPKTWSCLSSFQSKQLGLPFSLYGQQTDQESASEIPLLCSCQSPFLRKEVLFLTLDCGRATCHPCHCGPVALLAS